MNEEFRTTQIGAGYSDISCGNERDKEEIKEKLKEYFMNCFEFAYKGIEKLFFGVVTIGTLFLFGNLFGIKTDNSSREVGKNIENICADTSKPIYSEPESNISLWNLDGKGEYGNIDIEAVTSYSSPKKVLWYDSLYIQEMKNKGFVINDESKIFTPYEKQRANRVANYQVFQSALAKAKTESKSKK